MKNKIYFLQSIVVYYLKKISLTGKYRKIQNASSTSGREISKYLRTKLCLQL